MVWPAIIAGGAAILGSQIAGRSNVRAAREANRGNLRIDRENRNWQDANYNRSMSAQFGNDYQNGQVYGGKGSDILGRDRDLTYSSKQLHRSFKDMGSYGLTPQEIAGSPVPGGTSQSGGNNVLGGAEQAASRERSSARAQLASNMMQSQTQLSTAKIHADAQIKSEMIRSGVSLVGQGVQQNTARYVSDMANKTGKYSADQISKAQMAAAKLYTDTSRTNVLAQLKVNSRINDSKIQQIAAQTALAMQDIRFKKVVHNERWQKLFAGMSGENVLASVFAVKAGIDVKKVLQNVPIANRKSLDNFINMVLSSKSVMARESAGGHYFLDSNAQPVIDSVKSLVSDSIKSLYPN